MNPRAPEVELLVIAEIRAEVPGIGGRSPLNPSAASRRAQPRQEPTPASEERKPPVVCNALRAESFRFDDPYWDEVFDSYHNPTLRTCCRF
jgi:hypothetical protein